MYASTREDELRIVPWPPEVKQAFLQDQFNKQHTHYLSGYPNALWLVLEHASEPAGRIYVEQTGSEIRLMEISLLPACRNAGVGTSLMNALLAHADLQGLPVTLHVEPYNPAKRLYQRCGFLDVETRGYYVLMQRMPRSH
ncbi:GNAT family N-acetyltransferase [Caenimonas koreensis]|uniref:GNAT family N-acetyltransferase n=1 Tax=Caenimonas koreensis TaxID=367474 RepID=UPI003783695C